MFYDHINRPYVVETRYGCYSDYGWTLATQGHDHFCDAEAVKNNFGDDYRVVDNFTGEVLVGDTQ